MGFLKPEQVSGGDLPWHALHSRPSNLQLPWTPGKDDKTTKTLAKASTKALMQAQ